MQSSVSARRRLAKEFVASAPLCMTLVGLDGEHLAMSPPCKSLLETVAGLSVADILTRNAMDIPQVQGVRGMSAEAFARLSAGEEIVQTERRVRLTSGAHINLRCQASYWRGPEGEPIAVLFVLHDVTAEFEAGVARAQSEAQLRAVLDNLPSQIALIDLDQGTIQLANASSKIAGSTFGDGVGKSYRDLLSPELAAQFDQHVRWADDQGGFYESEHDHASGAAPGCVIRVRHRILTDQHGRRQLLLMAEDITQLRQTTEALQRAVAEAEAANRAKSEFLANMSHEIRTPLNGVMGVAGALARTRLEPAQQEMVQLIETSAKTLETLLSDILDLARIEAGKMELRPEPFDLAASVNACSALFDAAAQAKGLDLSVEIGPEALGAYVGDAARLRQILANLLGNAVKFTTVGQVKLSVSARRGETSSELVFEVRDTGIGFDAETKARLFSRFEQADGSITRRFGGSGLGLSISRSLAEAMGGRLEADAEPGEGAVFTMTVELPRCDGTLDLWFDEADPEPAPDPLVGMRVLLAEDHPTNRRVVELILGAAGVELTCVENGVEAVDAFRRGAFDLVLMDMQMPLMDGLTAIQEIRKLERAEAARPTPIHVLTANAMPEHVEASHAAGADGHLSKPILADDLLERVLKVALVRTGRPDAEAACSRPVEVDLLPCASGS